MYVFQPDPHGIVWLSTPATSITEWTSYRTVRSGDLYEVFYGVPESGVWNSLGSYTAAPGSMSSGGQFRMFIGGREDPGIWELDNISVTPEPATLGLLALGSLTLLRRRK